MKYASASTGVADPYRAGLELGQRLVPLTPQAVLVFCTIHYVDELRDLVTGLRDVLGEDVLVCGGTGDGIYETSGVANHGVTALGIQSEGQSQWKAVLARGVQANSAKAAEDAALRAQAELAAPITTAFVLADGLKADGSLLVHGLRRVMNVPCFGGLTADDRRFRRSPVFLNDEVADDALLLLAASGRVPVRLNAASGWRPVGDFGRVTRADGQVLLEIDGQPAQNFLRDQTGKTMGGMALAVLPLAAYPSENDNEYVLRSTSHIEPHGPVSLFGRITEGARVRVCHGSMTEILGGVATALTGVRAADFEPAAVVVISCAGRKWLLAEGGQEEVDRTVHELGSLPLVGMPSFGEISPFRAQDGTYSPIFFHNVTFVVSVLGR